jgi:hypothetical protein
MDELTNKGQHRAEEWLRALRPDDSERRRRHRREADRELERKAAREERREVRELVYRVIERLLWVALAVVSLLMGQGLPA